MTPDDIAQLLRSEIRYLRASKEPVPGDMREAMADRLEMALAGLQDERLRGVIDDRMQTTPSAKGALAKVREENRTPAMLAVLGAGWSVRQLATEMSTREFAWNDKKPVGISHNQLTRILRGEVSPSPDIRRAVREVCKVKI